MTDCRFGAPVCAFYATGGCTCAHMKEHAPAAPDEREALPQGFRSLDDYMAEVRRDPEHAKRIEEARPAVLRAMNHSLLDDLRVLTAERDALKAALRELVEDFECYCPPHGGPCGHCMGVAALAAPEDAP